METDDGNSKRDGKDEVDHSGLVSSSGLWKINGPSRCQDICKDPLIRSAEASNGSTSLKKS